MHTGMRLNGKFLEGNQQWNICVGTVETVNERVAECSRELLCVDFTENIDSACEVSSCFKPGEAINDFMTLRMFTSSLRLLRSVLSSVKTVFQIAPILYSCPRNRIELRL